MLNKVLGRRAGSLKGYSYSKALQEAGSEGLTWSVVELDGYIANPRGYLRGTRMAFSGLGNAVARGDLIAYLKTLNAVKSGETRTFR